LACCSGWSCRAGGSIWSHGSHAGSGGAVLKPDTWNVGRQHLLFTSLQSFTGGRTNGRLW
jgi:hypothetical protein